MPLKNLLVVVTTVCCFVRHSFQRHQLLHRHLLPVTKFCRQIALPCALTCWRSVQNIETWNWHAPCHHFHIYDDSEHRSRRSWGCTWPLCWLKLCLVRYDGLDAVFSLVMPSSRLYFSAFPRSHKISCYPLLQATPCQTAHEILEDVASANASHTSMYVAKQCVLYASSQTTLPSIAVWRSLKWLLLFIITAYYYFHIHD